MSRILLVQHSPSVGPGSFAEYCRVNGHVFDVVRIDQGHSLPSSLEGYDGLCLMGGQMSVNDPLPWIEQECELIRRATAQNIPVIGHCLGGQMISKALGGRVKKHVRKELGWSSLKVVDADLAKEWLGENTEQIPTFQWHGDTFNWPPGALPFLWNEHCAHQAYVIPLKGKAAHLGMQCHMEMTPELVRAWAEEGAEEIVEALKADGSAVQTEAQMLERLGGRCETLARYAFRLYDRWFVGVMEASLI